MASGSNWTSTSSELREQWKNPGDILSLLLLIGGDIVQRSIAQLIGYRVHLPGRGSYTLSVAPVAFSFGWVAYGFTNLLSAFGDKKLMPSADRASLVINCSNGFARETQSWALERLLRDHERRYKVDPRPKAEGGREESLRIDIFNLKPITKPSLDFVWWLGWFTIVAQVGIAIPPWVRHNDWGPMLVTLSGNLLAAITCAMPQWNQEKWAGRKLEKPKVTCLTRGNGFRHIMVFIGSKDSWDMESLATGTSVPRPETHWISLILAICWVCLLISVSGLKEHAWYLVGIGGLGMLQNIFAASKSRSASTANFSITRFSRAPTIIGVYPGQYTDEPNADIKIHEDINDLENVKKWAEGKPVAPNAGLSMPPWLESMSSRDGVPAWLEPLGSRSTDGITRVTYGVHGALMELEKWVPTAGLANVQLFFPDGLEYNDASIRDNIHKKFWKRAYGTAKIRKAAVEKLREEEARATAPMSGNGVGP